MERWLSRRVITKMPRFLAGISLLGFGVALMDAAHLGFGPWSVLAEGVAIQSGIALGTADILLGIPILFGWLLVQERPGLGTVINVFGVGLAINAGIAVLPEPGLIVTRGAFTTAGVIAVGVGSALYLSAVLVIGFVLGGTVGFGTVLTAFGVGVVIQASLRLFDREGRVMVQRSPA